MDRQEGIFIFGSDETRSQQIAVIPPQQIVAIPPVVPPQNTVPADSLEGEVNVIDYALVLKALEIESTR